MGGTDRTTITVSRVVKDRFLKFVGAPKRFDSADEALIALLDKWDGKEGSKSISGVGQGGARSR